MKSVAKKQCLVCGVNGDGSHFGAESCRACAAFFRRSVALQKIYRCKAFGRCEIHSSVRCLCRSCRLNKCLKVGMRKQEVRHQKITQKRPARTTSAQEEGSLSEEEILVEIENAKLVEDNLPTLQNIKAAYLQLEAVRKVVHGRDGDDVFSEHFGIETKPYQVLRAHNINRNPRAINYKESCEVNCKEIKLGIDFLQNAFPELANLPSEQKKVLYNHFFLSFLLLENGYYCSLNGRTDIVFVQSGNYIDYRRPETFYLDIHNKQNMSTEDAVRMFASSFVVYRRNILDPMRRMKITDIEFFALIAFSLWEQGLDGLSDETEKVAREMRDRVGKEIVFYYNEVVRDPDYAVRLTSTLTLLRTLQRAVRRFQHDVEISNVFNVYAVDSNVYEVMNGKL